MLYISKTWSECIMACIVHSCDRYVCVVLIYSLFIYCVHIYITYYINMAYLVCSVFMCVYACVTASPYGYLVHSAGKHVVGMYVVGHALILSDPWCHVGLYCEYSDILCDIGYILLNISTSSVISCLISSCITGYILVCVHQGSSIL